MALNWIHNRKQQATAVETYERLHQSAGFEIVHADRADFLRAVELLGIYKMCSTIAANRATENSRKIHFDKFSMNSNESNIDSCRRRDEAMAR